MDKGLKANPDKCDEIIKMKTYTSKEMIMKFNGMFITLKKFILISI